MDYFTELGYLTLKWLHIVSAALLFGTGFGTAAYVFAAHRSGNVAAIALVTRWAARAGCCITMPAVLLLPASGYLMMRMANYPLSAPWLTLSLQWYVLALLCWLPLAWLQLAMRNMAALASAKGTALPARYWRHEKTCMALGLAVFAVQLAVYWLMVHKPA